MLRPKTPEPTMRMLEGVFGVEDDMVVEQDGWGRRLSGGGRVATRRKCRRWIGNDTSKGRGSAYLACGLSTPCGFSTDLIHVVLLVFG